ncbi:MAG: tRNA (adenosine(37)-N6)-threonylcarbamoyltransferase complex dimerization subunit type 1 TsaB, partial [Lachnospiraceae bacterium]
MKILAIDSSGLVATVAVLEDDELIAEYTVNYKKTHSETLLPMLDEIKSMINLDLSEIDAIAVTKGPGSFTGLRIGSATVKGLAYALNVPIISVPTVDALSMNLWGSDKLIVPVMDARREQVYTGIYEFAGGEHT